MRFDILTIFPGFFSGFLEHGIVRRAQADGLASISIHDLRQFTHDRHRTVDDRPFGGGEGMVLKPEPLAEALESLGVQPKSAGSTSPAHCSLVPSPSVPSPSVPSPPVPHSPVVLLSAQGRPFTQAIARELVKCDRLILLCGRYEGIDERVNELYCDEEISIGDYVLSGGELPAAVIMDTVIRLIPGALGNEASSAFESFGAEDTTIATDVPGVPRSQHGSGGLLDYPHYTRPAEFKGLAAPQVLLNGDHAEIRRWRREQQLRKTLTNRPDLLDRAQLSEDDRRLLAFWGWRRA